MTSGHDIHAWLRVIALVDAICFRYVRTVGSAYAVANCKAIQPPDEEKRLYGPEDVTVIIPTLDGDSPQIRECVTTILKNGPQSIILVTIEKNHVRALELAHDLGEKKIKVFSIKQANKRLQMLRGLAEVDTPLTVFADDDVFWKVKTLLYLLAPFQSGSVGATGTSQRLRQNPNATFAERCRDFLPALYLERRNFDCGSCNWLDGGVPCLSGRTAMYRTEILKDPEFETAFRHEQWRGSKLNHADDDNFLTRWLVSHNWEIKFQYSDECEVETTLEHGWIYILQCLRWARSNWRSNLTSLSERHIWRRHPWSTYSVFITTITAWSLIWDIGLVLLLIDTMQLFSRVTCLIVYVLYFLLWLAARNVKLLGHFKRHPRDIPLLPMSIVFGWLHCLFIKTWALFTLAQTKWGSRPNADVDDDWRMAPSTPPPYLSSALVTTPPKLLVELELIGATQPPRPHRSLPEDSNTASLMA